MMSDIKTLALAAKKASRKTAVLGQEEKNKGLICAAEELLAQTEQILAGNQKDVDAAKEKGMKDSLIDRLSLTRERIEAMAQGLKDVSKLPDPVGEMTGMKVRPNGLQIGQKRTPLGVVGIIYESRPNVTADAFDCVLRQGMPQC